MFVVKTHRHMAGEPRQFITGIFGPFAEWQSASDYADAFCHLWRDERATASIDCLYEPSEVILDIVERNRKEQRADAMFASEAQETHEALNKAFDWRDRCEEAR